jgi:hypothetical protein
MMLPDFKLKSSYIHPLSWDLILIYKLTASYNLRVEIAVSVDIKPQSCPNPINSKSQGVLPVAILGTADFDVTQVDPSSVRIEGVAPMRWNYEDVATPFEPYTGKGDCVSDCTYAGLDGYMDLTLKFDTKEIITAIGEVSDGNCVLLQVTGNLKEEFGSIPIKGEDVVIVIKQGKK